jgi:hypothetical protein
MAGNPAGGQRQLTPAVFEQDAGVFSSIITSAQQMASAFASLGPGLFQVVAPLNAFGGALRQLTNTLQASSKEGAGGFFAGVVGGFGKVAAAAGLAGGALMALAGGSLLGGFEVLGDAVKYLVAVIGSALAPVFVVLIAGILTLADQLRGELAPAAEGAGDSFGVLVGVVSSVVDGFMILIDGLKIVWHSLKIGFDAFVNMIDTAGTRLGEAVVQLMSFIPGSGVSKKDAALDMAADEKALAQRSTQRKSEGQEHLNAIGAAVGDITRRASGAPGADGKTTRENMASNLDSVMKALTQAAGQNSKANVGFSGIADVWKTMQMNTIQSDIQARTLDTQMKTLENVKKLVQLWGRPSVPAIGS